MTSTPTNDVAPVHEGGRGLKHAGEHEQQHARSGCARP